MNKARVAELAKKLGMARMALLRETPFFGILLMHMRYALDDACRTAATDGEKIYFAPKFLDSLSLAETKFILLHEILHVALEHCFRQNDRDGRIFNIACDIVVNDVIKEQTLCYPQDGHVAGAPILGGLPDGRSGAECSAEEVYDLLVSSHAKKKPVSAKSGAGVKSRENVLDDRGEAEEWQEHCLDNHGYWPPHVGNAPNLDNMAEKWRHIVQQAALTAERYAAGSLPLLAKRVLAALRKPRIAWRRLLYNFIRHETFDYTFEQPDRRYNAGGCLLPGWYDTRPIMRLWVAVDASASMSDRQLADVLSEIGGIIRVCGGRIFMSFFDVKITGPVEITHGDFFHIQPMGGGGTNFYCVFEMLRSMQTKPDIIIIMTDGYATFPSLSASLGIPVLWLLNNSNVEPPWGRTVRLL